MATIGNIIGNTIGILIKKPFILIFWGIIMLVFTLAGYLLPVLRTLFELSFIGGSNPFETFMSFIQLVYSYLTEPKIVIISIVALVLLFLSISVISGALMSGYYFVLNNVVNKKAKKKGEFSYGLKQYFSKISLMNFKLLLIGFLLIVVMMVASVPALVTTRTLIGKGKEMLPAVLFVDVLTGFVIFFGFMFYRIYTFFWYPAVINNIKKPFKEARLMVNKHFWKIMSVFVVFDTIYIAFQMLFIKFNENLALLLLKWFFTTVFYAMFTTYIFAAYKRYSHNKQ